MIINNYNVGDAV